MLIGLLLLGFNFYWLYHLHKLQAVNKSKVLHICYHAFGVHCMILLLTFPF